MPIYEYRCEQGHQFEVMQRMADDPVSSCQTCAAPVTRVFHPIAVHFKGSGFYNTDYGTKKRAREKEEASKNESSSKDSSSSSGPDSGASKSEPSSSSSSSSSNGSKADSSATKPEKKTSKAD